MGRVTTETILSTREREITPLIKEVLAILRGHPETERCRVFLYGSWVSMNARPTSDVDIAVLGKGPIDEMVFLKIREEVDSLPTLRAIDIVDLGRADKEFRERILRESEELFL